MNYAQLLINVTHDIYGSVPCDQVGVDVILGVDIILKYLQSKNYPNEIISQFYFKTILNQC